MSRHKEFKPRSTIIWSLRWIDQDDLTPKSDANMVLRLEINLRIKCRGQYERRRALIEPMLLTLMPDLSQQTQLNSPGLIPIQAD